MEPKWIRLERTGSTNNWITEYLKGETQPGELVVTADFQESGRGQGGNSWVSGEGENLLMSLLLLPEFLSAGDQFQLTRMASLALVDFLRSIGVASMIKWPNDIVTGYGKIAGILIELGVRGLNLTHAIIGIGLNLNQAEFPEFRLPATSVNLETGNRVPPEDAARGLLSHLSGWYETIRSGDSGALERAYLERLYGMGRTIILEPREVQHRRGAVSGILKGVNEVGELRLELPGGTIRTYHSGVVRMRM